LNNNLIKNASENKAERKTIKKQYRVCIVWKTKVSFFFLSGSIHS
jgi:hypothetical protein